MKTRKPVNFYPELYRQKVRRSVGAYWADHVRAWHWFWNALMPQNLSGFQGSTFGLQGTETSKFTSSNSSFTKSAIETAQLSQNGLGLLKTRSAIITSLEQVIHNPIVSYPASYF
jgi:hypothetical protein